MKKVFSFILSNIFSLALLGILVCCLLAGHVVLSMFVAVYHGVSILLKEIRDINKGNSARVKNLEEVLLYAKTTLKDFANNFDCDEDAHKYKTTCRACEAKNVLAAIELIL